jgi:uncharacterized Zn-finger protein
MAKVSCLCGADVRVDPMSPTRRVTCPACRSTFDFVGTMDAARKNSRISLILPRGALEASQTQLPPAAPTRAAAPQAPARAVTKVQKKAPGKTLRGIVAACDCGEHFPVEDDGELSSIQSCPHCGRSYHVAFKIDAATRAKTAMMAPLREDRLKKPRTVVRPPSPRPKR